MAKRPKGQKAKTTRNLTFRKAKQIYLWRNPVSGQEVSLVLIPRCDAVAQAIEANNYMLYSPVRHGERKPAPLTPDGLTQAFADMRDSTDLKFGPNPPSFHEIRSLAGRLYEVEYGEKFAQHLPGHKNIAMTKKYLDARGAEYVMVCGDVWFWEFSGRNKETCIT